MNAIAALPIVDPSGERHSDARQTRIPQLDGLRGIAVLLVVLYHFVPGFFCLDAFLALAMLLALMRPQGWWSSFCQLGFLRNAGGVSYCVYIIHFAALEICQEVIVLHFREWPLLAHLAGVLVAGLATWAIAKTSWRYLESPMIRRGHAYSYALREDRSFEDEASPSNRTKVS